MNWDQVEGNWKQFKGKIRETWGKFTDRRIWKSCTEHVNNYVGKLQEKYGLKREEAEKELDEHLSKW